MNWSALNSFWDWVSATWSLLLPRPVIVFPQDPVGGQEFGRFAWNDTKGTWDFS